ncbi:hypothetical protein K491DRAFT_674675 [Lophiostoma macrostomum CBS 122681]|uniref:Uncharacterized protein n=1 Tax=Lophiostoma macrostomum CBS 122681 TaxID=1314788 RepID=A0A6A6TMK2_9PLEO|nr:hypothetical protein K491DRAFT_674675 [Lophiostoma macrostomum CBS 122681]
MAFTSDSSSISASTWGDGVATSYSSHTNPETSSSVSVQTTISSEEKTASPTSTSSTYSSLPSVVILSSSSSDSFSTALSTTSTSSTFPSSQTSVQITTSSTSVPGVSGSSSDLSLAAKAVIGVSVALVIIVVTLAACVYRFPVFTSRKSDAPAARALTEPSSRQYKSELDGEPISEMEGVSSIQIHHELPIPDVRSTGVAESTHNDIGDSGMNEVVCAQS